MAGIRIDRLALQVPGLSEAESQSLALQLANRLAKAPMRGSSRQIESLQLTLAISDNARPDQLADMIAEELLRQIVRERG